MLKEKVVNVKDTKFIVISSKILWYIQETNISTYYVTFTIQSCSNKEGSFNKKYLFTSNKKHFGWNITFLTSTLTLRFVGKIQKFIHKTFSFLFFFFFFWKFTDKYYTCTEKWWFGLNTGFSLRNKRHSRQSLTTFRRKSSYPTTGRTRCHLRVFRILCCTHCRNPRPRTNRIGLSFSARRIP